MRGFALCVVAVLALSSRAFAQDDEDEDDDVELTEVAGDAPSFDGPDAEEMENQRNQQRVLRHVMETVSTPCRDELSAIMQLSPEQQQTARVSDECRAEIQSAVAGLQEGAPAGGAGGAGGAAGAAAAEKKGSYVLIASQVLLIVFTCLAGVLGYAWWADRARREALESNPELARKIEARLKKRSEKAAKRPQGPSSMAM